MESSLMRLRKRNNAGKTPTVIGETGDSFKNTDANVTKSESVETDNKNNAQIEEKSVSKVWILGECAKAVLSVFKPLFDTKENKNRRGFYRINPKSARRIHNDIVDGSESECEDEINLRESCSGTSSSSTQSSRRRKLKESAEKMMKVGQEKEFEVEKIILAICALIILFGYPIVLYFNLMLF